MRIKYKTEIEPYGEQWKVTLAITDIKQETRKYQGDEGIMKSNNSPGMGIGAHGKWIATSYLPNQLPLVNSLQEHTEEQALKTAENIKTLIRKWAKYGTPTI
jgi:hypothetical protein